MNASRRLLFVSLSLALGFVAPGRGATSGLWGTNGELWSATSRLPDFSYAGYHCGEAPLPDVAPGVSIKQFGAKGDGATDDTQAFLAALAAVKNGAIEVPAGRYVITNILEIKRSGVVLRGAGADKTVLFFPRPLQEIKPDWGETTTGRKTSNYSWSGGFVWFKGSFGGRVLAGITAGAQRGEHTLTVSDANGFHSGQRVKIYQKDNVDNSLATALYSGDPGDTKNLRGSTYAAMVCRITKIEGDDKLRAFAALVIDDCFLVGDLRVVEGEDGYFVAMPSRRKRDGSFKDIAYPLNNLLREQIEERVLLAYETATGHRALSRIERGEAAQVRPDLLSVEEFGFTPKTNP